MKDNSGKKIKVKTSKKQWREHVNLCNIGKSREASGCRPSGPVNLSEFEASIINLLNNMSNRPKHTEQSEEGMPLHETYATPPVSMKSIRQAILKNNVMGSGTMKSEHKAEMNLSYNYITGGTVTDQNEAYMRMHMALLKRFTGRGLVWLERYGRTVQIKMQLANYNEEDVLEMIKELRHECVLEVKQGRVQELAKVVNETKTVMWMSQAGTNYHARINGSWHELERVREAFRGKQDNARQSRAESSAICIETAKFGYAQLFYASTIEKILRSNNSEISHSTKGSQTVIAIRARTKLDIRNTVELLAILFSRVVCIGSSEVPARSVQQSMARISELMILTARGTLVINNGLKEETGSAGRWISRTLLDAQTGMFVCGKRCGKLNKIAASTQCRITAEWEVPEIKIANELAEESGSVLPTQLCITASGRRDALVRCLGMLRGELPASGSCRIENRFHKQLIGVNGRAIQQIMRYYNVYVRLFSKQETSKLGMTDNVELRTPFKNFESLELIKKELYRSVGQCCSSGVSRYATLFGDMNGNDVEHSDGKANVRTILRRAFSV